MDLERLLETADQAAEAGAFERARELYREAILQGADEDAVWWSLEEAEHWSTVSFCRRAFDRAPANGRRALRLAQAIRFGLGARRLELCTIAVENLRGHERLRAHLVRIRAGLQGRRYPYLIQDVDAVWAYCAAHEKARGVRKSVLGLICASNDVTLIRVLDRLVELAIFQEDEREVLFLKRQLLEALDSVTF